jgi:hypothetical protein
MQRLRVRQPHASGIGICLGLSTTVVLLSPEWFGNILSPFLKWTFTSGEPIERDDGGFHIGIFGHPPGNPSNNLPKISGSCGRSGQALGMYNRYNYLKVLHKLQKICMVGR